MDKFEEQGGRLDYLILNAGIAVANYNATENGWESRYYSVSLLEEPLVTLTVYKSITSRLRFLRYCCFRAWLKRRGTTLLPHAWSLLAVRHITLQRLTSRSETVMNRSRSSEVRNIVRASMLIVANAFASFLCVTGRCNIATMTPNVSAGTFVDV